MQRVVILGAGVAGLTAALHLAERGLQPLLIEADPGAVGGRLKDGPEVVLDQAGRQWRFPSEHGVHGIWAPYVNLRGLLARHGLLPDLQPSPDEAWIHSEGARVRQAAIGSAIHGSPIPAPFHYLHLFTRWRFLMMLGPDDLLALPRVVGTLFVALAIDPIGEQNPLRGESLARFTQGWSPRLRSFFAGLARNALAAHPEDVPAAGFIAFLRFYTIARRDAWAFSFLPGTGGACVAEPLARAAAAHGATIQLAARATRLAREGEGWVVNVDTPQGEQRLHADQVILALDAPAARALLEAGPDTAARAADLWFPQGVPTAIIRIWFERKPRTLAPSGIFSGDFVVDNFFWLETFQPAYAAWARATGGGAVETHIYGPPEVLARPDAALLAQALTDVTRAFPDAGRVLHSDIQRNPATHTLFGVAEPGRHLGVTTPWPGITACGDWVAHPTPALYLERAATTGISAANAILEQQGLEAWPLLAPPPGEPLALRIGAWLSGVRRLARRRRESTRRRAG
jgi:carotenoid phi-ring synthase / carotenoid chi-ring synthase